MKRCSVGGESGGDSYDEVLKRIYYADEYETHKRFILNTSNNYSTRGVSD